MIPPPVKLSDEIVGAARLAVAGGATVVEVADRLGVSYEALRKRSLRGGWLTPQRVARATEQRVTQQATQITAASRVERGQRYEALLSQAAERFAQRASELDAESLISKAANIERMDKVSRRTLGLDGDKPDANQINIALLGSYGDEDFPTMKKATPTLEAQDK